MKKLLLLIILLLPLVFEGCSKYKIIQKVSQNNKGNVLDDTYCVETTVHYRTTSTTKGSVTDATFKIENDEIEKFKRELKERRNER